MYKKVPYRHDRFIWDGCRKITYHLAVSTLIREVSLVNLA